jgi:hypothetical protein
MKITSVLLGAAFWILPLCAANSHPDVEEKNANPRGIRIASKDGVLEPDEQDQERAPVRDYYLVDRNGKRRSGTIGEAILPLRYDSITVQWLDYQKSLVVITNRHKHFVIWAFARSAGGFYSQLHSEIDGRDAMEKMARALVSKATPGIPVGKLDEDAEFDCGHVDVDSLIEDETGVTLPVIMDMRNEMTMKVLYKFDHYKLRFIRKSATLQNSKGEPILSFSGTELEKLLKK